MFLGGFRLPTWLGINGDLQWRQLVSTNLAAWQSDLVPLNWDLMWRVLTLLWWGYIFCVPVRRSSLYEWVHILVHSWTGCAAGYPQKTSELVTLSCWKECKVITISPQISGGCCCLFCGCLHNNDWLNFLYIQQKTAIYVSFLVSEAWANVQKWLDCIQCVKINIVVSWEKENWQVFVVLREESSHLCPLDIVVPTSPNVAHT